MDSQIHEVGILEDSELDTVAGGMKNLDKVSSYTGPGQQGGGGGKVVGGTDNSGLEGALIGLGIGLLLGGL